MNDRSPLDETDRVLIKHLRTCNFLPASSHKRFAKSVGRISDMAAGTLSPRQRSWLDALVYRYRRQIPAAVVAKAALRLAAEQAAFRLALREQVAVEIGGIAEGKELKVVLPAPAAEEIRAAERLHVSFHLSAGRNEGKDGRRG